MTGKDAAAARLFADVTRCTQCDSSTFGRLLRDEGESIPQPGYVGKRYEQKRVLLVGQNPGRPNPSKPNLVARDRAYTALLRKHAEAQSPESFLALIAELEDFIPDWPVHGSYFPLEECGLHLDEIAYTNIVRCRTQGDAAPGQRLVANCSRSHLWPFVELLEPVVVIFIGKWASDQFAQTLQSKGIPSAYMNRMRSLSTEEREENRRSVSELVLRMTYE